MKSKEDTVFIMHIYDAIKTINDYKSGFDYYKFEETKLVQDGIIRQLEIIGEATKKLSQNFRDKYSNIPLERYGRYEG